MARLPACGWHCGVLRAAIPGAAAATIRFPSGAATSIRSAAITSTEGSRRHGRPTKEPVHRDRAHRADHDRLPAVRDAAVREAEAAGAGADTDSNTNADGTWPDATGVIARDRAGPATGGPQCRARNGGSAEVPHRGAGGEPAY